jgi:hypothetical protein
MERYIYFDGQFFDRVSNTAAQMARSLDAEIVTVKRFKTACGLSNCDHARVTQG